MSSPSQVAGATQEAAGKTANTAKDEAQQVGQHAQQAAVEVAGTAKEQIGAVTGEAVNQAKDLFEQAREEFTEQAGNATVKLGESVKALVAELRHMADGAGDTQGPATQVARRLADKGDQLADYLNGQRPGGMVQDLRSLASQRPGGFLLGALAAGLVTGRVVRGASAAAHDDTAAKPVPDSMYAQPVPDTTYVQPVATRATPELVDTTNPYPATYAGFAGAEAPGIQTVPGAPGFPATAEDELVIRPGMAPVDRTLGPR